MTLVLGAAAERPPLSTGRPALWLYTSAQGHPRAGARRLLREILADYLELPRDEVPLRLETGQAPQLGAAWRGLGLSLSLSYAGRIALIGLCAGVRIGVDITPILPLPDALPVARLYFGPAGEAALAALPPAQRAEAFARAWAELEARAKCLGRGLQEWSPTPQRQGDPASMGVETLAHAGHVVAVARCAG